MNPPRISPDHPRLTAYALGELDPAESAGIAAALRADPAAAAAVAEIRAMAGLLSDALESESGDIAPERPRTRRGARFAWVCGGAGLAAACVVGFLVLERQIRENQIREIIAQSRTRLQAVQGARDHKPTARIGRAGAPQKVGVVRPETPKDADALAYFGSSAAPSTKIEDAAKLSTPGPITTTGSALQAPALDQNVTFNAAVMGRMAFYIPSEARGSTGLSVRSAGVQSGGAIIPPVEWSPAVDGVRGRLVIAAADSGSQANGVKGMDIRDKDQGGLELFFEVQNTSSGPVALKQVLFSGAGSFQWHVTDAKGNAVPQVPDSGILANGVALSYPLILPPSSTLRCLVGTLSPKDLLPGDGVGDRLVYYLSATFDAGQPKTGSNYWQGTLALPKVPMPTK